MIDYIKPPFLFKKKIKNILVNEVNLKEYPFINESLGSFNNQANVAKEVANEFIEMLKNGEKEKDSKIEIDGEEINTHLVLVLRKDLLNKTYADTMPEGDILPNKIVLTSLRFTLYLSQFDKLSLNGETLLKKITSVISHELMHGNIFSKRIANNQDIDIVDWYGGIKSIIENESNELARNVAYAMYACYYQERQSIISSTYGQLLEVFNDSIITYIKNKVDGLTDNEKYDYLLKMYKKRLVETESYQTFAIINDICNKITDKEINAINNLFVGYGINVNLNKEIGKMKIVFTEALKDVARNGSLFFYEYLLKEFGL